MTQISPGVTLRRTSPAKARVDAVVVGVRPGPEGPLVAPGGEDVADAFGGDLPATLRVLGLTGAAGDAARVATTGRLAAPQLVLVGLGPDGAADPVALRRAAGVAARTLGPAETVALALPAREPAAVRAVAEGFLLGSYRFSGYRSGADQSATAPAEVLLLTEGARSREHAAALGVATAVAAAVRRTRDWVNTPPADLTPARFAEEVRAAAKARPGARVSVTVSDETELAERGFGGILGVGQGSANPPRLVRLTYRPRRAHGRLGLVGKGITFDSGGLSIKPATSMPTMKSDMAGAAAVVSATFAIADLGLPLAVTAWVPMAENMPSGSATRPGDVLTMYGGRTVEVLNTDAEGRLVLAEALVLAGEARPDLVVDVATLTGAQERALGDRVAGLFGNDEALVDRLRAAGLRAGEELWPMPVPEEMRVKVRTRSTVADLMQHNQDVYGGAGYAAAFLAEFVPEGLPWGHLDIAGPSYNGRGAYGHVPSGGTGFAVASLVELALQLAAG